MQFYRGMGSLLAATALFASHAAADMAWRVETIDTLDSAIPNPSLAVIGTTPVVVYNGPNNTVCYGARTANGWSTSTAIDGGTLLWKDSLTILSGIPYFVYQNASDGYLYAAGLTQTGWQSEQINNHVDSYFASLVAHSSSLYTAYELRPARDLWVGTRDGAGWQLEQVWTSGSPGRHANMAFSDGKPIVAAADFFNLYVFEENASGQWTQTKLEGGDPLYVDLAELSDRTSLTFYQKSDGDLVLWERMLGETSWSRTVVDSSGDVGRHSSITESELGRAISYYRNDLEEVRVAFERTLGGWDSYVVEAGVPLPQADCCKISSLAFGDQYGVAYADAGAGVLKFAVVPEPGTLVILSSGLVVLAARAAWRWRKRIATRAKHFRRRSSVS